MTVIIFKDDKYIGMIQVKSIIEYLFYCRIQYGVLQLSGGMAAIFI